MLCKSEKLTLLRHQTEPVRYQGRMMIDPFTAYLVGKAVVSGELVP